VTVPLSDALVGDLHGVVEVGLQLPDLSLHLLRVLLAPAPGVDGPVSTVVGIKKIKINCIPFDPFVLPNTCHFLPKGRLSFANKKLVFQAYRTIW
jgi:hypothetical protein